MQKYEILMKTRNLCPHKMPICTTTLPTGYGQQDTFFSSNRQKIRIFVTDSLQKVVNLQ